MLFKTLILVFAILLQNVMTQVTNTCSKYEVQINNECVQCNTILHGCNQCQLSTDRQFYNSQNQPVVECTVCDYSMYLLQFNSDTSQSQKLDKKSDKKLLNICLNRCEDYGHNYVSNPNTMKCEFCGEGCTACTLQYGCSVCYNNNYTQHSSVPESLFPYSTNDHVKQYKAPSSQFKICQKCADARCEDCNPVIPVSGSSEDEDEDEIDPMERTAEQNATIAEQTFIKEFHEKNNLKQTCNKCSSLFDQYSGQLTNTYCTLPTALPYGSVTEDSACLWQTTKNGTCNVCNKGFFKNSLGKCSRCDSKVDGCTHCNDKGQCLSCKHGYTHNWQGEVTVGNNTQEATGSCTKCNLKSENDDFYEFLNNRCEQCKDDNPNTCKFCENGWWGSTHKQSYFIKDGKNLTDSCQLKCGEGQYPHVAFDKILIKDGGKTLGQEYKIKDNGKSCQMCDEDCVNCIGPTDNDCTECKPSEFLQLDIDAGKQAGTCLGKVGDIASLANIQMRDGYSYPSAKGDDLQFTTVHQFKQQQVLADAINAYRPAQREYLNIYVSNLIDEETEPARQRNGTYADPFAQLTDALVRAEEIIASFPALIDVKIHLYKGNHYLIENRFDALNIYHKRLSIDDFRMNMNLTIKPIDCSDRDPITQKPVDKSICVNPGEKVTVHNKIRERLNFKVLQVFKMERIIIDSLDSILPFGTPCLSERRQCCKMTESDQPEIVDFDSQKPEECSSFFEDLKLSDNCKIGQPLSMFQMINRQENVDGEKSLKDQTTTNHFVLKDSEIKHIFWGMASIVRMTKAGGQVILDGARFEGINTCGSVFSNEVVDMPKTNFGGIDSTIIPTAARRLLQNLEGFQRNLTDAYNFKQTGWETNPAPPTDDEEEAVAAVAVFKDNYVKIRDSSFVWLNFGSAKITNSKQLMVSDAAGARHQGLVLSLNNFPGEVEITGSEFENNLFLFDSCDVLATIDDEYVPVKENSTTPLNVTNNLQLLKRKTEWKYDKVQIKSLIDILNHREKLMLQNNRFSNNTGLKGIVNIELALNQPVFKNSKLLSEVESSTGIVIYNNTFEQNSGLIEANVLNLRKRVHTLSLVPDDFDRSSPDVDEFVQKDLDCGGFHISKNHFSKNIGCHNTLGAMYIYCIQNEPRRNISYVDSIDSQFMLESFRDTALKRFAVPRKIAAGHTQAHEKGNYTISNGALISVQSSKLILEGNVYDGNFAGQKRSLVEAQGFPLFESTQETYQNNGNWFHSEFRLLSSFFKFKARGDPDEPALAELPTFKEKSLSMLKVRRPWVVTINGTLFQNNSIVDFIEPSVNNISQNNDLYNKQSHGILVTDLIGEFKLIGGTTFKDNRGYKNQGFRTRLIQFERSLFQRVIFDNIKFIGNEAYNYNGTYSITPRLFNITKSDFDIEKVIWDNSYASLKETYMLNDVTITENFFRNTDCMVQMPRLNFTYTNFQIHENGRRNGRRLHDGDNSYYEAEDAHDAVVKFDITSQDRITIKGMNATGNYLMKGSVIAFNPLDEPALKKPYFKKINILITANSNFQDNMSQGPTSSITIDGFTPWLWFIFESSSLMNNWGAITQDIYALALRRLEIVRSRWGQSPKSQRYNDVPPQLRGGKVMFVDKHEYQIHVEDTVFDCQMDFDDDQVFSMSLNDDAGENSLFTFMVPTAPDSFFKAEREASADDEDEGDVYPETLVQYDRDLGCVPLDMTGWPNDHTIIGYQKCTHKMKYWQFINNRYQNCNQANRGAIFNVQNGAQVNISNSIALNNSAFLGGFAYLTGHNSSIEIKKNMTLTQQRGYFGSSFYLDQFAQVNLSNSIITQNEVYEGAIHLTNFAKIFLTNMNFSKNKAHNRAVIQSHVYAYFEVVDSIFTDNTAARESVVIHVEDGQEIFSVADEAKRDGVSSKLVNTLVTKNNVLDEGGSLIKIVYSNFTMQNVTVLKNNVTTMHGGVHLAFANLKLTDSQFETDRENWGQLYDEDVSESLIGGFVYVGTDSLLLSERNTYQYSRGYVGGCIAIQGQGTAVLKDDLFHKCSANIGGAIYAVDFHNLTINNCTFKDNIVYSGFGSNIFGQRYFGYVNITNSTMTTYTNAVWLEDGHDLIANNLYLDQTQNLIDNSAAYPEDAPFYVGMFNMSGNKPFRKDTTIYGTAPAPRDYDARTIALFPPDARRRYKHRKALSEQIQYSQNYQFYAGGFYLKNMKKISNFKNVTMVGLKGKYGGCIDIELDQTTREQGQTYNSHFYYFENINLTSCLSWEDGGAINIKNVHSISIQDSSLTDSYAFGSGGGINFVCDKMDQGDCVLKLDNTTITKNTASRNGGGIYWPDKKPLFVNATVDSEGLITGNKAGVYGNDFASSPIKIVRLLTRLNASTGMAAKGQSVEDVFTTYSTLDGSGAQPAITPLSYEDTPEDGTNYEIKSVQSGGFIPQQYLALLDEYEQICANNIGAYVRVVVSDPETVINGAQRFFSANGVYNVSGMEIQTSPGKHGVYISAIAESKALEGPDGPMGEPYVSKFDLRISKCKVGEAQLKKVSGNKVNYICQKCYQGTYLLIEPEPEVETRCQVCNGQMATCTGGSRIGPKRGYWRKSNITDAFLPCKNPQACVGLFINRDAKTYSPTGNCADGYYGALCGACWPGWVKNGYECTQCEDPQLNLLRMAGVLILFILALVMLVSSTIDEESQKSRQTHSVFIKILMNHLQMIFITTSFNMKWPPELLQFFSQIAIVVQAQKMIVAFDCFMDHRQWSNITQTEYQVPAYDLQSQEMDLFGVNIVQTRNLTFQDELHDPLRITYYKLFMYAAMPVVCGIAAFVTWYFQYKCRFKHNKGRQYEEWKGQLYTKFISTMVILLFLLHPQITQYMIDLVNCQAYDGDIRLEMDLQIVCWQTRHETFSKWIAYPGFVTWGLGIPLIIWVLMSKEKDNLNTDSAKIKFGFLFNGYKRANYTWEIVIMYRKTLCLCLSVFLSGIGIIVQALFLLIILGVFLSLNSAKRPFAERTLNEVEDISLATQIITIYCGLFFISQVDELDPTYNKGTDFVMTPETQFIFFMTIVTTNVIFMVVWLIKFIMTLKTMIKGSSPGLYVVLFLCCNRSKLIKDEVKLAREAKREIIIEKIEEIQFFIKDMKEIYSKEIFYQGHDKFMSLLYYIESEKKKVDLTVKKHNLYIQGNIARDRKFNPNRINELKKLRTLEVDDIDAQGFDLQSNRSRRGERSKRRMENKKKELQLINKDFNRVYDGKENLSDADSDSATRDQIKEPILLDSVNQLMPPESQVKRLDMSKISALQNKGRRDILGSIKLEGSLQKIEQNWMLDSKSEGGTDDEESPGKREKDLKAKLNILEVTQVSRNARCKIPIEHKSRIFAQDKAENNYAHQYMIDYFKDFVEKSPEKFNDSYDDEDSPIKDVDFVQVAGLDSYKNQAEGSPQIGQKLQQSFDDRGGDLLMTPRQKGKKDGLDIAQDASSLAATKLKKKSSKRRKQSAVSGGDSSPSPTSPKSQQSKSPHKKSPRKDGQSPTKMDKLKLSEIKQSEFGSGAKKMSKDSSPSCSSASGSRSKAKKLATEEKRRVQLRPDSNIEYRMEVDQKTSNLKLVQKLKPILKKKQFEEVKDDVTGEVTMIEISEDEDQLKVTIIHSSDEDNIRLRYKEQKIITKDKAFSGSYSERQKSQLKSAEQSPAKIPGPDVPSKLSKESSVESSRQIQSSQAMSSQEQSTNQQFYNPAAKDTTGKETSGTTDKVMFRGVGQASGVIVGISSAEMSGEQTVFNAPAKTRPLSGQISSPNKQGQFDFLRNSEPGSSAQIILSEEDQEAELLIALQQKHKKEAKEESRNRTPFRKLAKKKYDEDSS